ncbi:MAG: hypothetical protein ABSD52_06440 [Candidatus Cybelea sp.]|jgi:hypothetical protein
MSKGLIKLIGACLSAALLSACSTQVAPMAPLPAPAHALVLLGLNTGTKAGLNVSLSVGGTSTRRFLLDTGSTGLWVYPNAIGHYSKTRYAVMNSYGSGLVYEGILVYTIVDFGSGLATGEVPVALVQRATCTPSVTTCPATPSKHNCPGVKPGRDAGIRCLEVGRKLFGTFGAALLTIPVPSKQPVTELYNVLFGIAQPWAGSFIVTPQAIEVGPYTTNGFDTMPLTLQSPAPAQPIPSGAHGWSKGATLCFRVGRLRNYCIETTFDTGATSIDFLTAVKLPLKQTQCGERVKNGTPFEMRAQDGTVLADFDAGQMANWNVITSHGPKGPLRVNTGVTFFNRDEVLFDAVNGRIGLRKLTTPGQIERTGCNGSGGN